MNGTTPVGRYSPQGDSPYGCVDMAGNVWEWTALEYIQGSTRAVRGGSWMVDFQVTRAAYQYYFDLKSWYYFIGFRVAEHLSDPGS